MKTHPVVFALFALVALADVADAQGRWTGESRSPGWEFGADLTYLLGSKIDFDGGSSIDVDDDVGLAMAVGYRFSSRFEVQFSLDYSTADYDANLQSATAPTLRTRVSGEVETFTAFGKAVFNVLEGPITPYVSSTWTLRLSYEKQFVDFDFGSGTPDFDVFRIGLTVRY